MRCDKKNMLLYAVTDRTWTGRQTLYEQTEAALKGGVTCVQLREKELDEQAFFEEAILLKKLCKKYGVPFIINDSVKIAIKCGADGVHVGQSDMTARDVRTAIGESMILGVSAQTVEEAKLAYEAGADYLGVGAMFPTDTKTDALSVSRMTLKEICKAVPIPVTAIGGIHKRNILELAGCGADGVALVSAIFSAENIESECCCLKALAEKILENN